MNMKLTAIAAAAAVTLLSGCVTRPTVAPQPRKVGDFAITYHALSNVGNDQAEGNAVCGTDAYQTVNSSVRRQLTPNVFDEDVTLQNGEHYEATYWICGTKKAASMYDPKAMDAQRAEENGKLFTRLNGMTPAEQRHFYTKERHFLWATCEFWGDVVMITGDVPAVSIASGVTGASAATVSKGTYYQRFNNGSMLAVFDPTRKDHAMFVQAGDTVYSCADAHEDTH